MDLAGAGAGLFLELSLVAMAEDMSFLIDENAVVIGDGHWAGGQMRLLTKQPKRSKGIVRKVPRTRGGVVVRSAEGVRFAYTTTQVRPAKKTSANS